MLTQSAALRRTLTTFLLLALSLCLVLPAAAIFDSAFFNSGDSDLEIAAINPAGEEVPPSRQLVLRFNRPVVPIGRMERDMSEIPVAITPALACEWRWLDTANLACQLGEKEALRPATRYTVTVQPGIKAEDGATLRHTMTHSFVTERPRLVAYSFSTWQAPGMPVIRVQFNQPVTASSAAQHLFFKSNDGTRSAAQVIEESERPTPSFPDDEAGAEGGTAIDPVLHGTSWLVSPQQELPADSSIELQVEPGIKAVGGIEAGNEARTVVVFNTFPDFAFLGVQCRTNAGAELLFAPGLQPKAGQFCSPHDQVALLFSTPVAARVLGQGVKTIPALTPVEADPEELEYDAAIAEPHQPGKKYTTFLPYWYDAYQPFTLLAGSAALQDIFGRPLPQDIRQMFFTDHYRPSYDFAHHIAVLEKGVASEVPIEIRNLERIDLSGDALTARGKQRSQAEPDLQRRSRQRLPRPSRPAQAPRRPLRRAGRSLRDDTADR